ncbi:hypothetical protein AOC05_17335 [Arthrobacter alpinus]|uniref:Ig-like domain-containing protein n=1 Tax=Arthrobacter alpinus TaxID=656366 RepID=A0A0M4R0W9_9MICC|nr:hypothetical protein [Arthrobacter alpinus]ALE93677.1 hypothetical protein AOC05_17335 [Arthrobacter alpinus]
MVGTLSIAFALTGLTVVSAPANAVVVGACTMKANDPHASVHVSGTINSEGTLKCTIGMTEIYLRTYLEKSGGPTWGGNTESWLNATAGKTYKSVANTSCSQGPATFRTRVAYTLQSPPGVSPAYTANNIYSPWFGLACGVAFRSTQAEESNSEWTTEKALPPGVVMQRTPDGVQLTFGAQN